MSVLPQLERELLAAHRRLGGQRRLRVIPAIGSRLAAGWLSRTAAAIPVLLALAVTVAVALVALLGLHHGAPPSPPSGGPPPSAPPPIPRVTPADERLQKYLQAANQSTFKRDPACGPRPRAGRGTISYGSPSRAMLSAFSVLRRAATPADKPRGGLFHHGPPPFARDVYIRYVRRAQYHFGGGYYLIPAGNVVMDSTPSRCFAEQIAALKSELPRIPKAERASAVRFQAEQLAYQRYRQLHPEGICLEHLNDQGFGGGGCGGTLAEQGQHPGLGLSEGDSEGGWIQSGLVPDGIASITYQYAGKPATRTGRKPERPFTITVPVINNIVVFKVPPGVGQSPLTMLLRSASGTILRTIHPGQ